MEKTNDEIDSSLFFPDNQFDQKSEDLNEINLLDLDSCIVCKSQINLHACTCGICICIDCKRSHKCEKICPIGKEMIIMDPSIQNTCFKCKRQFCINCFYFLFLCDFCDFYYCKDCDEFPSRCLSKKCENMEKRGLFCIDCVKERVHCEACGEQVYRK